MQLLDSVLRSDGTIMRGIVDFSNTRHLIFLDLTNNPDPSLTMKILDWRLFYPELRFTVYSSMYGIDHPPLILLSKKSISSSSLANPAQRVRKSERVSKQL